MRRKNGFVLFETLIVVLLLTVSLMSLYTAFSAAMVRIRERNTSDTIDSVYKIYFIKDLLDSNYINSQSIKEYSDSFVYYASDESINNKICKPYDYVSGDQVRTGLDHNGGRMVVCDFEDFRKDNADATYGNDVLYSAITTYGIDKIYYINYKKLNESRVANDLYNKLDASSIDYVKQKPADDGNFIIVKVRKTIFSDDEAGLDDEFMIKSEYYHSSLALSSVTLAEAASPITLKDQNGGPDVIKTSYSTMGYYVNGAQYLLTANHEFTTQPGKIIVGWTTDEGGTLVNSPETLSECINNFDSYKARGVECYAVNSIMRVSNDNRVLYAIWCGNGDLLSSVKCQSDSYTAPDNNGEGAHIRALPETDPTGKITFQDGTVGRIVYEGDDTNNYVVIGTQCFNMISNFDSTTGIKSIYAGTYDSTAGECVFESTVTSINGNTKYKYADHRYESHAWMYGNKIDVFEVGSADTVATGLGLHEYVHYEIESADVGTEWNQYGYFGDNVTWNGSKYTLVDSSGKKVTEKKLFHGYKASNYDEIRQNALGKYVCESGDDNVCDHVYYLNSIYTDSTTKKDNLSMYIYRNGLTHSNYLDTHIVFAKNISYSGTTKLYTLKDVHENVTLRDIYQKDKMKNAFTSTSMLSGYHYMCENPFVRSDHTYICENAAYILSFSGTGAYVPLKHGMKTLSDFDNYTKTNLEDKNANLESPIKKVLDTYYETYLKAYEDKLDTTVTFCNLSVRSRTEGLGSTQRSTHLYNETIKNGVDYYYYAASHANRNIGECDTDIYGTRYLYSVSTSNGNGLLKHPIGLITKDEAVYMGLKVNAETTKKTFLFNSGLTMSASVQSTQPSDKTNRPSFGGYIIGSNQISGAGEDYGAKYNVRPVISIKIDNRIVGGDGSRTNPFILG